MTKNKNLILIASLLFTALAGFWAVIALKGLQGDSDTAELFSAIYCSMALFGGITGLVISRRWGGLKSLVGRSVVFMSLGLLAQVAGQVTYSLYTYLFHEEIPYPSWGDAGFFGSVIFYILGAYFLIKALHAGGSMGTWGRKLGVAILPLALLSFSYFIFLKDYSFDSSQPLTTFLDFGYPLGQAFYLSLGLGALVLSRKYLGGVMRPVILFLIFALFLQYLADFVFLYQNSRGTWETAGINELMYLISYFVMTLSLIEFGMVLKRLGSKK
jgi:hypothetical protein